MKRSSYEINFYLLLQCPVNLAHFQPTLSKAASSMERLLLKGFKFAGHVPLVLMNQGSVVVCAHLALSSIPLFLLVQHQLLNAWVSGLYDQGYTKAYHRLHRNRLREADYTQNSG